MLQCLELRRKRYIVLHCVVSKVKQLGKKTLDDCFRMCSVWQEAQIVSIQLAIWSANCMQQNLFRRHTPRIYLNKIKYSCVHNTVLTHRKSSRKFDDLINSFSCFLFFSLDWSWQKRVRTNAYSRYRTMSSLQRFWNVNVQIWFPKFNGQFFLLHWLKHTKQSRGNDAVHAIWGRLNSQYRI